MTSEPLFLRRFEQIRTSLRRYQVRLGLAATLLVAAAGLGLLAWADFRLELPRTSRAIGLAGVSLAVVFVLARWLVAPLRWWTEPRTALEIEGRFPQLGQRIRTVVQYAGQPDEVIASEGVKPSLVEALEADTEAQVSPLPLDRIIRWNRVFALSFLAVIPLAFLIVASSLSQEWSTAIHRAILVERPYTTIEVTPGNVLVDQGVTVPLAIEVKGRPRQEVVLETRPVGKADAPWKSSKIEALAKGPASRREATVEKVKDPVEYRVVAGPASSGTYAIRIRYPLAIKEIEVKVTAPAYTGLDPKTVKGGDVQAVEGSVAAFKIVLDDLPSEASLEMVDLSMKPKKGEPAPAPIVLPLKREGNALVATLDLTRDLDYKILAKTADGRFLPKNKYRIDVREDRAPRVVFDEPDEVLEVHPIAEVKHRVRVDDDFGLSKAGIVFRFNDGEEKTLVFKDFPVEKGKKPKTSSVLEEMLLIETLAATPQDSITYYAFAEDNFPGTPRRTETDLRYIDLRAFKREYKLAEPGSGDGDPADLIALGELIARQRVNLNRASRLAKHKPTDRTEADDPLKIAGFEEALLTLTKEFTEGIEAVADARVDSLHKAIDAMQASLDSLDRGRYADAPPAMAEALKFLIAARRELAFLIGSDSAMAAAMRKFDRSQAQKIRKPKSQDQEAEEIADKLEELAQEEEFVYATIATSMQGNQSAKEGKKGKPAEPKDAPKPDEAKENKEGPKGQEGPKGEGDKGKDGPKGEGEKGTEGENGKEGPGKEGPKGEGSQGKEGTKGPGSQGDKPGQGQGEEGENGSGDPRKLDRRAVAEKQEMIADKARELEEKLKKLEAASDLAKARMAKAAEKVEKVSGDLARGNAKEAADDAKAGAGMLHELARQVKGEIAREAADQIAMARDLAQELAAREADLANRNEDPLAPGTPGEKEGKDGQAKNEKQGEGQGEKEGQGKDGKGGEGKDGEGKDGKGGEGKDGEGKDGKDGQGKDGQGQGQGTKPGQGGSNGGSGGWGNLTEAEQIERMAEMAKTLEAWLKQIDKKGEGKAADAVGEILEKGNVAEIVERTERMGELRVGGKKSEMSREAKDLAAKLELLTQSLEMLHRGIVAPQLAAMVDFDRRLAEMTEKLGTMKTEAEMAAWQREAASLIRDMEKAGVAGATELGDALRAGGGLHWDAANRRYALSEAAFTALQSISVQIKDRVQDLILKDLASARDEATPPMYREMVERYYEVISRGGKAK